MPTTGFLRRSVNVLSRRAEAERERTHPWRQRLIAMGGGLVLALATFFVLKGAVVATGRALPGDGGLAMWLVGADPVSSALAATLQPIFSGRG